MSRKGKMPVALPKGVEVAVEGQKLTVKGAKGTMSHEMRSDMSIRIADGLVHVEPNIEATPEVRRFHGLTRSLLENMILGVSVGFVRKLELVGVGFRAQLKGHMLDLQLGFSHPTQVEVPQGIKVEIEKNTLITISGIDKCEVGQFAADVRSLKKPEPYQGKGIKYSDEVVRRKAGKAGKK